MACTDFITKADFILLYPEFSDPSFDAIIDLKLMCLPAKFCADTWDENLFEGSAAYLAHLMTIFKKTSTGGGTGGPITSKSMGPVSVGYGSTSTAEGGSLSETTAGREYMRMRDDCVVATGFAPGMGLEECC